MTKENKEVQFTDQVDNSIIAYFPPGFFQKGLKHIESHPDEEFTMQVKNSKIYLRRQRRQIDGQRPKDKVNGRIISWSNLQREDGPAVE